MRIAVNAGGVLCVATSRRSIAVRFTLISRPYFKPTTRLGSARRRHMQAANCSLLDHFVGEREHGPGNGEAERFGSLEVDYQFELGRLLDREFARSRAL